MDERLTEEQQIEVLKKLWKEYGLAIVLGAIIAAILSFGWRFYQDYKNKHAMQASLLYERVITDVMNNEVSDATTQSQILIQHYASTPYASLSALMLAKLSVQKNALDDALSHLNWVIDHGSSSTFKNVARIRAAQIKIAQNKAEAALKLLKSVSGKAFIPWQEQVRGDAYVQQNDLAKARDAYEKALTLLPSTASTRTLLQMKLNDLPMTSK